MQNTSHLQRIYQALFKARQVMVVDASSRKAARNWSIRPITFWLTPIILIAAGILFDHYYLTEKTSVKVYSQDIQLQKQLQQLRNERTAIEANNDVKQAHIHSLEGVIKKQQESIAKSNERLRGLESILEARKNKGTKVLKASITQVTPKVLNFSLTLVKGGNYPRYSRGKIRFITQNKHGNNVRLHFENEQTTLPFRMETHIFLQGQLYWADDADKPEHLGDITVIISDLKGKKITQEKCTFEDF
ncbi:MAG: hypothetical protein Q9M20_07595 [Mariprofundaceae bacterium]|nr:hypothetical protein [Mariprofundaceae bacterium]